MSIHRSPEASDIGSIARGAGVVFAGTAAGLVFRYGFQVLAARELGPRLFGMFFLGLSVYQILEVAAQCGLPNGVVRFVSIYAGQEDVGRTKGTIRSALKVSWISSLILAAAVTASARPLAERVFHSPGTVLTFCVFAGLLPFSATTAVFVHAAQGFHRMGDRVVVTEVFVPAARILLVALFLASGLGLGGVLAAYAAPVVLAAFAAWRLLRRRFPAISDRSVKAVSSVSRLLSFSWPLVFIQFVGVMLLWTDTLMLGIFRPAADVGIYGAVQRTTILGTIILTAFNTVFAPMISRLHDRGQMLRLRLLFQTTAKWAFTFSLPLYLGLILLRKPLLGLFGPEFERGAAALAILSFGYLVHSGTGSTGILLSMSGRPLINLANMAAFFVLNVVLNLVLIPKHGMAGAAAATATTLIAGNAVSIVITRALLRVIPFRLDFLKPLGAGVLAGGVFFLVRKVASAPESPAGLIAGGAVFVLFYFLFLMILGLTSDDREALAHLYSLILRKRTSAAG